MTQRLGKGEIQEIIMALEFQNRTFEECERCAETQLERGLAHLKKQENESIIKKLSRAIENGSKIIKIGE